MFTTPLFGTLAISDRPTIFAMIAGYLAVLVVVGVVFRRFSKDTSDYFRAGGKATWWLIGGSMFMQSFSAWTFTGAAGAAFQAGWSLPVMMFSGVLIFAVFALLTGPWFRQLRCITGADVIRLRFGVPMEQFIAGLGTVMGPIFGGVQLYSLAIFTSVLMDVRIAPTIVLLGCVVLFYSALSGAWAVLAADFIKAVVLMPVSILLGILCLHAVGGIGGLLAAIHHAGLDAAYAPVKSPAVLAGMRGVNPGWFTWAFFFAWYANNLINSNALSGPSCPRFLAAKDGREARRAALFAGALLFVGIFIWFIPPMTARLLIPQEVRSMPLARPVEGAYAAISIFLLPPALVGIVLVGMCAATMSTLDTGLTSLAGNIAENIYPAICRRLGVTPWRGHARLIFAKGVNVACAGAIILCAIAMATYGTGGVFQIVLNLLGTIVPPIAVPMALALFFRRVRPVAVFVSIAVGLAASLGIFLAPRFASIPPWTFQAQVAAVIAMTLVCFLAVRAACPADQATLARETEFFGRRDRPVNFAVEIGQGNDGAQLRIVGIFGIAVGLAILLLLIPTSSRGYAVEILAVSATTFAVGASMTWAGVHLGRRHAAKAFQPGTPDTHVA